MSKALHQLSNVICKGIETFLFSHGARPRGRPKKTWREIVEKDCQAHKLNKQDVVDRKNQKKHIRDD